MAMRIPKIRLTRRQTLSGAVSLIIFLTLALLLLFVAFSKRSFLGAHFFYDADTIASYIVLSPYFSTVDSFESTAATYSFLGIAQTWPGEVFFQSIVLLVIVASELLRSNRADMNAWKLGAIFLLAFFSFVYLTELSKDFFLIVLIFLLPRKNIVRIFAWFAVVALYALFFRKYWFIVLSISAVLLFVNRREISLWKTALAISILAVGLAYSFPVFVGTDLDTIRSTVNDSREAVGTRDMNTVITSFLPGSGGALSALNLLLVWISLIFPFPLVLLGTPYYVIIFISIVYIFSNLLFQISRIYRFPSAWGIEVSLPLSLILGFSLTQAIFEPDYGSYLRHLTVMLPLFIRIFVPRFINQK